MTANTGGRVGTDIREEFPIFESKTYVNTCSQGALSRRVRDAYLEYLAGWDENGAEWDHWVERSEAMRSAFAGLLGAAPAEVAITTSVSQAVSALMSTFDFRASERRRIVLGDYEFPTMGQIAHAQELRGAEVVHVRPGPDGSLPPERFAEVIDERTALVCCATISYRTGHRQDIGAVAEIAHRHGALCMADSYQGFGAMELNPRAIGVDFMTAGTVKYLLASAGLGFLYVRAEVLPDLVPTQTGWFADEDIFQMDLDDYSPASDARRFDAGTPPVPNIYGGVAGASLIAEAGPARIEEHVAELKEELFDGLDRLGLVAVTPRSPKSSGPLVCVRSHDAPGLVQTLAADGIVASSREDSLRIALHLYNASCDIETILDALNRHRHLVVEVG